MSLAIALAFNAIVFALALCAFTLLRPYFREIYEPRAYVLPIPKRAKPLSQNIFLWLLEVWRADYRSIKHINGVDAYFFVRFLRMMVRVLLPTWFISWTVLIPVTTVNTSVSGIDGLDKLTYGNIDPNHQARYAAHLFLAWVFTSWILYNIKHEMHHFIVTRQEYLTSPHHAKSLQANTILITSVPVKYLNRCSLLKLFDDLPGGVKKIWINRDLGDLPDVYNRRLAACEKLESAETTLQRTAAKLHLKERDKTEDKAAAGKGTDVKEGADLEAAPLDLGNAASIVPRDQRPTHRLGLLPFTGKKVDTIKWAREKIKECNMLLEEGRAVIREEDAVWGEKEFQVANQAAGSEGSHKKSFAVVKETTGALEDASVAIEDKVTARVSGYGNMKYPFLNSAFITFNEQISAYLATQALTHYKPFRMTGKYNEVSPKDVVWANLHLGPYKRKVLRVLSYGLTVCLIVPWLFLVASIGSLSNIASLCGGPTWICSLPAPVVNIISSVLSAALLATLMDLLSTALRRLTLCEGIPKLTDVELSLMNKHFTLEVGSFFMFMFGPGIIVDFFYSPTTMPDTFATEFLDASNFWLAYVVLGGLSGTSKELLRVLRLIRYYAELSILRSTPRSVYRVKRSLENVEWGSLFSSITFLSVISIAYSITSPVINGLACVTFFAFCHLYKYNFLWVYEQSPVSDTGGLFFRKAIQHIFVGLYIKQISLCVLFFLARDANNDASASTKGALVIVLIAITAWFHSTINRSYDPLLHPPSVNLENETYFPVDGVSEHQHKAQDSEGAKSSTDDVNEKDDDTGIGANVDCSTSGQNKEQDEGDSSQDAAASDENEKVGDTEVDADVDCNSSCQNEEQGEGDSLQGAASSDANEKNGGTEVDADVDCNTPGQNKESDKGDSSQDVTSRQKFEEDEFGFVHPAIWRPQRVVWIPKDALGLGEEEVRRCKEMGITASTEGTIMNEKGKVDVPRVDEVPEEIVWPVD